MIKQSALLTALVLAAGCAHHTSENRVVVSENSSPYVSGGAAVGGTTSTYGTSYGTGIYGPGWNEDYDNTSKGAGARALMANPYADNTTYYSGAPAGAAVAIGTDTTEDETSKGAGARELKQDNAVNETTTTGAVVTGDTETSPTAAAANSQGEGARTLSGNGDEATDVSFKDDATFVRDAAQSGLAEVRMGELAQQNGQNQALKDFGQRIVQDHRKANDELMSIAQQKGMQTPTSMSQRQERTVDHLAALNGPEFDKAYGKDAVQAHERAVGLFRAEAQSGKDADLKAFAQKTLPVLEDHLRMARELNKTARQE